MGTRQVIVTLFFEPSRRRNNFAATLEEGLHRIVGHFPVRSSACTRVFGSSSCLLLGTGIRDKAREKERGCRKYPAPSVFIIPLLNRYSILNVADLSTAPDSSSTSTFQSPFMPPMDLFAQVLHREDCFTCWVTLPISFCSSVQT